MASRRKNIERAISNIDTGVKLLRARTKRLKRMVELKIEKQQERKRWLSRTTATLKKKGMLPE